MQNIKYTTCLRAFSLLFLLLIHYKSAFGQLSSHVVRLDKDPNSSVSVVVGTPTSVATVNAPEHTGTLQPYDQKVFNRHLFYIDLNYPTFPSSAKNVKIKVKVNRSKTGLSSDTTFYMEVNFQPNMSNNPFNQKQLIQYYGFYSLVTTIEEIFVNGTSVSTLPEYLVLQNEIIVDVQPMFLGVQGMNSVSFFKQLHDKDCDAKNESVTLSWSAVPGALEYQLEWLHINDYSYDPNNANSINLHRSPANLSYNFTENATRISTAQTNYNLNLVFDRGWVVYRVRALGLLDKQNPQSYYYSAWTLADAGTVGNVSNDKKLQIDNSLVHENALNWQYATTYAEEGKRKEVISYFDGSLRNRQTVTQINSDDNTVVGQTIYDAQGRPAVQVLPVPVLLDNCSSSGNAALRYYPKFNRFDDQTAYNSSHFEVSSEGTPCAISAAPMDENTGAALYYSPNNPKQNNAQGYVPDANGYPFTQVEYTPDNTGRIRRQSGVGATFQLGSGHETKYFYAQPNQLELNRLFGSEVGYALHYKKNMVIDANGQVSISYLDQEGRVIATALAGNAPSQLSALSSDATATSNLTINALGAENSSNLPNTEVNALLFNTQLALGYTTNLTFNYNFSMPPLTESCLPSVCFDCVYELTLELVDECGLNLITSDLQQKIVGKFTSNESGINFHGNCVAPLNGTPNLGTITLENVQAGTYSLNKILRLSQTAQEAFVEAYINNPANTCVKSFDDFLEEEMDNIDTSACNPTCESCLENLGSLDNFIIAGGTPEAYFQAKAACDLLCMGNNPSPCELSLMAMQMDMMPHGQYAAYLDPEGDQLNFSFHPLSILNPNHQLPNALASWRKPITKEGQFYYRGQSGDTSRIYLISNANGWSPQVLSTATVKKDAQQRSYIYAEELQHVEDFIDLFDYSWTASLVTYHPEWCYYQNCLSFDTKKQTTDAFASVDFDNKLIASTTFEQAVNNKFLNADYAFLFNSALPVVSISNPIEDWFTPPANNPQNGTRIWDAFAYFNPTEAAPCNVYGQQLSDAFTQYTVLNGSTLSMAQFAAYTARCGSFNVGLAPAACFDFGKMHNGVYDIEILNQEWGVLKSIYLAKKKALQQMYLDCKALDGCNQYGGCIGQADYQPGEPLSPYAGNSSHTTNVNAPCGQYTMHLYAEKQRRFPRNENLVSQIEANSSEYDFYLQSGLCPIDFALENLLTELVSNQQLTSNGISLNNTSSFFGIFCAINNLQNPGTIPTIAQQATISSNNDTLYLDWINQQIPQRVNRITLVNNDPVLTWTDFTHLQKLRVINDTTFKIYAIKAANGLLIDSTRLTGYISNLQLGACAFETTCTTNQVGLDLQHLFNVLATNNQIFPVTPLSIQEIVVGSDTLNLQTTALSAAASYSGTLYYVNALPSGGSLWIGYQQGSNNYGLEIKVTQIADPLFFSSSVPAYYSNWRSTSENSFKVDVYDSTGNFTVISGVLLRHHPTLPLAGIPSGYCSTPQSSQCRTKAHRTFEDFARLLPDVLKTQSSGGNFNFDLFNSIHFTQLIASQLPASLSATSSTYNATTDTLLIQAGDCEISLYLPGAVNLVHVTQIGEMAVSGAADPTGNYFDFTLDVTVNYQGQTLYKQLKGHSCLPLKACPPCQQTKLLAEDKNELGDYSGTFSGQSSQNGSSDCDSLYAAYLAYYATTSYYQAGIPAVSKDRFEPCLKLVRPSDECYAAYDQYLTCADGFNKWAGGPANYAYRIDTPFVALPSFLQANVCNCIDNYCARLQKIKDGLVTFSSQTDFNTYLSVAAVCPQPCDRVDDSTGMVWINIPADSVELVAGNNCVEALINQAYFSATLRYENYLDSLKGALNQRYRNHCMGIQESLTYSYTDKQHHYTLYYYDQAGNLIKTVPPAGVELLAITNDNDALNLQINNDRKFNTKNVFTSHRLVTRYEYNSLNQLVAQFTPDTDPMQPFELYLTNGLPAQLVTNRIQMLNEMVGYLAGEIGNRGYLFRTTDGGVTWNRISSIVGTDFNKVRMISANVGFAVGNQGAIFKTADGGQTWDMISLHNLSLTTALPNLNDIDYHSNASLPNVVTIVGDGGLVLRSLDLNTFRRTNTITSTRLLSISNDGTTQLILAENSSRNLFYSMACTGVDSIYTASGTSFRGLELYAIDSLSSNLVIAAGRDGRLYTKAWAAPTAFWNQLHNNLTEDITDLRFFDANEGIAISDCHLYRTFDGGLNWTLIDNHVYNSLDKTVDRVAIVAVGDDGRIALCLKGSASPTPWIIPSGTSEKLHAAWITRETSGTANTLTLAVSANNTIRYCWDISQAMPQWNVFTQPVNETVLKFCLKKTNGQTQTDGLIQTDANKLYRFKINGASTVHQAISLPQGTGVILMNKAPNYDDYFVVTNNYYLMRLSLNTSNNFVTSTTMLNSSVFANKTAMLADKDTVVMVGNYPVHIFRNAAGTTYSSRTQATEFATTKLTSIIRHSNQNTWVSAGEDGTLYYLSGTSWVQVPTLVNNRFNRLRANANDLLIAGNNGYLKGWKFNTATNVYNKTIDFQTTTGLPLEGAISEHLYDLVFSGNQLWVVGQNGRYLFTPDYSTTALGLFTKGNQDLRGIALAPSGSSPISVGSNAAVLLHQWSYALENTRLFIPPVKALHFYDAQYGTIGASRFTVRQTSDGGMTWKNVAAVNVAHTLNYTPSAVFMVSPTKTVLFGNGTTLNEPMRIVNLQATRIMTGNRNIRAVDKTDNFLVLINQPTTTMSLLVMDLNNNDAITSIGTFTSFDGYDLKVNSKKQLYIVGQQGFRCYNWNGVVGSNATLGFSVATGIFGNRKLNAIGMMDNYAMAVVGDNGAFYHSTDPSINSAGLLTGISWSVRTGVHTSGIDPHFVTAQNQIHLRTIAFSNSTHAVYGGTYTSNYLSTPTEPMVRYLYTAPSRFSARFFYDRLGRLVVSQNARQYNNSDGTGRKYSYSLYDALGRVVEAGEKTSSATNGLAFKDIFGTWVSNYYNPQVIDDAKLLAWIAGSGARREVTKSYYDQTVITGLPSTFTPDPLTQRKRITHVTYEETFDGNDQTYDHATHYDYDIHGNVKTLLQDNRKMATTFTALASQRYKRMDYRYDLVSGNVHRMSVQNGEVDQWHHAYRYDADNRIVAAYTNEHTPMLPMQRLSGALETELTENEDWENDAKYYYYAHGPLARTEIGNNNLQGYDYLYNLQGWMKGINAIENTNDPGNDGTAGVNSYFGKDLTAFSLSYFNGDYAPINASAPMASVNNASHAATNSAQLFNGNIRYMQTRLTNPNTGAAMPMLNAYKYDQLNRLLESRSYENSLSSHEWNPIGYNNEYFNRFSYDAMGNILTQQRHKSDGTLIEDMRYKYHYLDPTTKTKLKSNRLYHIYEPLSLSSLDPSDIDNMGAYDSTAVNINVTNNYSYDEEGRLIKDKAEFISKIVWRVDGKVKEIQRNGGSAKWMKFDYDAMGHRIAKHVYNTAGTVLERSTYYILDAQGNQVSTYDHEVVAETAQFNLKERNIFGSSRIGSKQDSLNVLTASISQNYKQIAGRKFYEFTNHLGNVLTVFTDLKIPQDTDNNNVVDNYKIGITRTADYSPFGVELDGRTLTYTIPVVTNGTPTVIYQHKFDDSPNAHPYTGTPSNLDANLTQVSWTNSRNAWTNFTGQTGRAIAINSATPDTTKLYLNLTVNPGYLLDVTSYSFYHRSSNTGYTNYRLYINNILVGNGSIFVSSGSTLQHTGTVNVSNAIAGLSGNITVRFDLFGGSNGSNGTFRMDDFVLNGYTTAVEHWSPAGYRYGFQNQEVDDEIKGNGNSVNYKYRMHDPRVGRFFAVDPLANQYSYNSTYSFSENKVIDGVELEGLEFKKRIAWNDVNKSMYQLKNNPESINQTGAGTCTMAAITYIWIKRDFESFHKAMVGLYFTGKAQVNNFKIEPDAHLFWVHPENSRNSMNNFYNPDELSTEDLVSDWIILSSLQNSLHPDKSFYGYANGENSKAGNSRKNLSYMMQNLLGLTNVTHKFYNSQESKDNMDPKKVLSNLEKLKGAGNEIVMEINAKLVGGGDGLHNVTYMGNYQDLGNGNVSFDVQNWGEKQTVTTNISDFKKYYNGATWGK